MAQVCSTLEQGGSSSRRQHGPMPHAKSRCFLPSVVHTYEPLPRSATTGCSQAGVGAKEINAMPLGGGDCNVGKAASEHPSSMLPLL
jgi:hypothetical protein